MEIKRVSSSNETLDFDSVLHTLIEVCKNNKIVDINDNEVDNQISELTSKLLKYDELLQQAKNMKSLMLEKYNLISEQIENMKSRCINKLNSPNEQTQ